MSTHTTKTTTATTTNVTTTLMNPTLFRPEPLSVPARMPFAAFQRGIPNENRPDWQEYVESDSRDRKSGTTNCDARYSPVHDQSTHAMISR
jgi:hypothetical protein